MDVGCYCVSGSRLLGGEPRRAAGAQVVGPSGVDVLFAGVMLQRDGMTAHFDCGLVVPERDELEVIGEEGSLFLDDPWHAHEPVIEVRRDGAVERIEIEKANSYGLELENLSAAIRGEAEPLARPRGRGRQRARDRAALRLGLSGRSRGWKYTAKPCSTRSQSAFRARSATCASGDAWTRRRSRARCARSASRCSRPTSTSRSSRTSSSACASGRSARRC